MDWTKYIRSILTMLLLVGLAVIFFFISKWLFHGAINQTITYVISLVLASIAADLLSGVVKKASKPLGELSETVFASNKRPYLEYLIYRYRFFETRGLSAQPEFDLDLERLFVDLHFRRFSSDEPIPDAINNIWGLLNNKQANSAKEPANRLVLLGEPGSGKTTLVKQVALMLAKGVVPTSAKRLSNKLPIILFLRDLDKPINNKPSISLGELVVASIGKTKQNIPPMNWFMSEIAKGNCVIAFDGLDEIADNYSRQNVVEWVQEQLDLYPKCHFIITSRPFGYITNPLRGVQVLRIEPYSGRQIDDFIYKWYFVNQIKKSGHEDEGVRMAADEASEDLIHRLGRRPALAALAVNPLLLTMIATVHSLKEHLPGHRVELYHDIFEVTLDRRSQHRWSISNLGTTQKILILQVLAYYMMRNNIRTIPASTAIEVIKKSLQDVNSNLMGEKFLKSIENDSGLLTEKDNGIYQFAHMTFQEYLASVHINADVAALEPLLIENVGNPWWEETIRLYSAQADATRIVEKCINIGSIQSLSLATDCLDEAVLIDIGIRDKLEAVLNNKMESTNREEWTIASKAKLASRLHWMVRLSEQLSIDTSLITNIEYQLFLDDLRQKGRNYYPDHWVTGRFPQNQGKLPVLGVRPSDAQEFCTWLTGGDSMGMVYHLPLLQEVDEHELNNEVYWLRRIKNDVPVPHPHEHAAIPIARDKVKELLTKDFNRLHMLISMLDRQSRHNEPTSVLLDRSPVLPRATSLAGGRIRDGMHSSASSANDREHEDRELEEHKARNAITVMRKYRDFIGFDMIQLSRFAQETVDRWDSPLNTYMGWFVIDAKPFYYRTGFDLSTVYETALLNVESGPLKLNLENDLKLMATALNNSLRLLYERKWFDLGDDDGRRLYRQLRWFVRLSMSLLAHNMQAKRDRDHFIEGLREFMVDAVILEDRLADRLKPLEGMRLVKEEPLKI